MGLFGKSRRLSWDELEQVVEELPALRNQERQYILGAFSAYRHSGITKYEIKKVIQELRSTTDDSISDSDAKKLQQKLLENL